MSFINPCTIVLRRVDYRVQPSFFQIADHALCLIRMLHIVFFQFMLQWLWPMLHYNEPDPLPIPVNWGTCDMWNAEDHTLSLKTCTHFLVELSASHHWFWLDQNSGLIPQRTSCTNSSCLQQSRTHGDFWPYSKLSWHSCTAGSTPGLTLTSVT